MPRSEYAHGLAVFVQDIDTSGCENSKRITGTTDGEYYQKPNKTYYCNVLLDPTSAIKLGVSEREYPITRLTRINQQSLIEP